MKNGVNLVNLREKLGQRRFLEDMRMRNNGKIVIVAFSDAFYSHFTSS